MWNLKKRVTQQILTGMWAGRGSSGRKRDIMHASFTTMNGKIFSPPNNEQQTNNTNWFSELSRFSNMTTYTVVAKS